MSEVENKLKKINELYDAGLITKAEFNELLKSEVLESDNKVSSNTDFKFLFKVLTVVSVLIALYSVFIFFSTTTSENKVTNLDILTPAAEKTMQSENKIGENSEEILMPSSVDTAASPENSFSGDLQKTDESNTSNSIQIGNQIWTTRNLDVSTYRNGDVIPEVQDANEWANLTTGAWCYYNNDSRKNLEYGKLYNWYAVNDPRGLAPEGFHIPSDAEWTELADFLGGENVASAKMKSTSGWNDASNQSNGNNSSGFSGLPGGGRQANGVFYFKDFFGSWWSSTESDETFVLLRKLYNDSGLGRFIEDKKFGFSVRCMKD